jgi:hypothetical protein
LLQEAVRVVEHLHHVVAVAVEVVQLFGKH